MSDKSPHLFFANGIITESNIADGKLLCLNSGQFLCLLYRAPLRAVFSLTIWGPPQTSFLVYFMGALSDLFLCILYGAPKVSSSLTIWGPLRSVSLYTIWGPSNQLLYILCGGNSDQFHRLLYGAPSGYSFFAYYMDPLRSVSVQLYKGLFRLDYSHTI